jgi:hypothetical protein
MDAKTQLLAMPAATDNDFSVSKGPRQILPPSRRRRVPRANTRRENQLIQIIAPSELEIIFL